MFCVLCFSCFCVYSLLPCGHLVGDTDLLTLVGPVNDFHVKNAEILNAVVVNP